MLSNPDWPTVKSAVARVFATLRKEGIYGLASAGFDQSEALLKVWKPPSHRGYAFYTSQDGARARTSRQPLWIGFGATRDSASSAEDVAVGREVRAALTAAGLHINWNEDRKTRLAVFASAAAAGAWETERSAPRKKSAVANPNSAEFFGRLREALMGLAASGRYHTGTDAEIKNEAAAATPGGSYFPVGELAKQLNRTVIAYHDHFSTDWDKIGINVTTFPTSHDKEVVREIAASLKTAGFKVANVYGWGIYVKAT